MALEPSGLMEAEARFAVAEEELAQRVAQRMRVTAAVSDPNDLAGGLEVTATTLQALIDKLIERGLFSRKAWLEFASERLETEHLGAVELWPSVGE
jgi:hypothetical protein